MVYRRYKVPLGALAALALLRPEAVMAAERPAIAVAVDLGRTRVLAARIADDAEVSDASAYLSEFAIELLQDRFPVFEFQLAPESGWNIQLSTRLAVQRPNVTFKDADVNLSVQVSGPGYSLFVDETVPQILPFNPGGHRGQLAGRLPDGERAERVWFGGKLKEVMNTTLEPVWQAIPIHVVATPRQKGSRMGVVTDLRYAQLVNASGIGSPTDAAAQPVALFAAKDQFDTVWFPTCWNEGGRIGGPLIDTAPAGRVECGAGRPLAHAPQQLAPHIYLTSYYGRRRF